MSDFLAAVVIVALLVAYYLCLVSLEEQERAFEDELVADHER